MAHRARATASAPRGSCACRRRPPRDQPHGAPGQAPDHGSQGSGHGAQAPAQAPSRTTQGAGHGGPHWDYRNPQRWGDLADEYRLCRDGRQQSPIDLGAPTDAGLAGLRVAYEPTQLRIVNNGHTIQVNYVPGSRLHTGLHVYELLQFHFHSPSEHTVAQRSYPLEIHFVHKNEQGELGVLGVLVQEGAQNLALEEIWLHLPQQADGEHFLAEVVINARDLLPKDQAYYRYMGSLTTPPCSEGVHWHVLAEPIEASADQIRRFADVFATNARPLQPDERPPADRPRGERSGDPLKATASTLRTSACRRGRRASGLMETNVLNRLNNLKISAKIYLLTVGLMVAIIATAAVGILKMEQIDYEIVGLAEREVPLTKALTAVTIHQLEQAVSFQRAIRLGQDLSGDGARRFAAMVERFESLSHEVDQAIERAVPLVDQAVVANAGRAAAEEFTRLRDQLATVTKEHTDYEKHAQEVIALVERGEVTELQSLLDGIYREQEQLDAQVEEALTNLENFMKESVEAAQDHQESAFVQLLIVTGVALGLGLVGAWLIIGAVARPLRQVCDDVAKIERGERAEIAGLGRKDEVGTLAAALNSFQDDALAAARVKAGLDDCQTSVLITDRDGEVVYFNNTLHRLADRGRGRDPDAVPQFEVARLLGSSAEIFFQSAGQPHGLLANLGGTHRTEVELGKLTFKLTASPVVGLDGTRIGAIVEFEDKTLELGVEREVDAVIEAAAKGDFTRQVTLDGKQGFMRKLAEGINRLSALVESATSDLARTLAALAKAISPSASPPSTRAASAS